MATADAEANFAAEAKSVPGSYSTLAFGALARIAFNADFHGRKNNQSSDECRDQ
jgi:hypothetical protein